MLFGCERVWAWEHVLSHPAVRRVFMALWSEDGGVSCRPSTADDASRIVPDLDLDFLSIIEPPV